MVFSGTYEHNIDAKNRLAVPSQVRDTLERMRLGRTLYVAPGPQRGSLSVWPEEHFLEMARRLPRSPIPHPAQRRYEELFFSAAYAVDIDNQGRILIPERLLQLARIGKQVVIIGVYDHLEIWNKQDFDELFSDFWEQYTEIQQKARQAILDNFERHRAEPDRNAQRQ